MYRIIAGFVGGVIITSVVSLVIFSFIPITGQEDGGSGLVSQISRVYSGALIQPIAKAGSEIEDTEMSRYYNDLVKECALDKEPAQPEDGNLASMVPDIAKITNTAINMPIIRARENIKDEKILKFYDQLVEKIGFE